MYQIIKSSLRSFFPQLNHISVEKALHKGSWNKDLHYKITVDSKAYSIRFIGENRSENGVFGEITNEVLVEQVKYTRFLTDNGLPFMKNISTIEGKPYTFVKYNNEIYRVVLFKWIEGVHQTQCSKEITESLAGLIKDIHKKSRNFHSTLLPKVSHLDGYAKFLSMLREYYQANAANNDNLFSEYIETAKMNINNASTNKLDYIVQSDFNPLNILWSKTDKEDKAIVGIVDFESVGYTDQIEALAWLIKWYSRTEGIKSKHFSPELAKSFLNIYDSESSLTSIDIGRLSSLIWLSGCLNWNFVKKALDNIKNNNLTELQDHLLQYKERGEELNLLLRNL